MTCLVETDLDKYDLFLRPNVEVQSIHDLLLRDVLLVLHQMTRYLLEVPDAKASEETRGLTTQIGFEMILSMFKNGSNVASDPIITRYMRDELSNGIIAHTSTKDLLVFEYMTSLLHIALRDYRRGMDTQISRLLSEFIFPVLEEALNDLFAYRKKYFILQMISKLCENERFMLDLYEMYDQQPEQPNYFEHLLFTLSKLAQGKSSKKFTSTMGNLIGTHAAGLLLDSHADLELIQDERSRKRALRCLVLITTALKRLAQRELAQTSVGAVASLASYLICG
jgi:brefeldin A-inhibited guanine nucleotide-exchange protein